MIQVIDNVISEEHQNYLMDIFHDDFAWYMSPTAYEKDASWSNSAVLYSTDKRKPIMSPRHIHFLPILFNACKEQNITIKEVLRVRCGLFYKNASVSKHRHHIDLVEPHKTLIYYANDSDGPTNICEKDGKIIQKIQPKKGRCFIMDGSVWHSSSHPRKTPYRIVVNINFK